MTAPRIWDQCEEPAAVFSPCRTWRYVLTRRWRGGGTVCAFIGLNPSTADETLNDPTIRRCMGFAKRWGHSALYMLNLFAYRATDPAVMRAAPYPDGVENWAWILRVALSADLVVCAWGAHGEFLGRAESVAVNLQANGVRLHHLGLTAAGHPRHPLYLRADLEPQPWNP
jgi:hypothetical protein